MLIDRRLAIALPWSVIYQPRISGLPEAVALSESERGVLEALSHLVVDGRQPEPVALGAIVAEAQTSAATVLEGVNRLRQRGWIVCTGLIHLDLEDRCLLLGEGLTRAAVMAAKRELALYEVVVDGRQYLVVYEQRRQESLKRARWTARAFELERAGSDSAGAGGAVMEADGATREEARDALVERLAGVDGGRGGEQLPENRLR